MTDLEGTLNNDDCNLVNQLWTYLDNPQSGDFYLGNIIRNGLKNDLLNIDIKPFSMVQVGDVPRQTMFEWALEYMGISMSDTVLAGLDSYQGGALTCTPTSATNTSVTLTLNFGALFFTGNYDVGVSGVTGCAIATAAAITGGNVSADRVLMAPGDTPTPGSEDQQLDLARWFRDDETRGLPSSENGRALLGAYYLQQDTINKVTAAPTTGAALYRQTLGKQRATADAVNASTAYYKDQTGTAPAPIGESTQYQGGFQSSFYLQMATQQLAEQEGVELEAEVAAASDNEYAQLSNAMNHFKAQVLGFQKSKPGTQQAAAVMAYIPTASVDTNVGVARHCDEFAQSVGIPIIDPETQAIVKYLPLFAIDRERALTAYAGVRNAVADKAWFNVKGAFSDIAQSVAFTVETSFTNTGGSLTATVTSMNLQIGPLLIVLGNKDGFSSEPTLYDRITNWIANTDSFQDTLKSKLNGGLNSDAMLANVQEALNGGLKKLGL